MEPNSNFHCIQRQSKIQTLEDDKTPKEKGVRYIESTSSISSTNIPYVNSRFPFPCQSMLGQSIL